MNFKPCSDKEIADSKLWAKADYPFEILNAEEKTSQEKGNPMFELTVKITGPDGAARTLTDYVLPRRAEKFKHCCAACGLLEKYETGILSDDDFVGRRGRLRLGVEKQKKNSEYGPRNVILDYLVGGAASRSNFFERNGSTTP
jgi:hypothetical protein